MPENLESVQLARPVVPTTPNNGQLPSNTIPQNLADTVRWAPTYYSRKAAIVFHSSRGSESFLIVGKLLTDAHDKKDWKHDGSGATSFYQWVERELGHKATNAKRLMGIWTGLKHLVTEQGRLIAQIEFSKLALVAPKMKNLDPDKQIELLHMASINSVRDLENNIREITGSQPATDTCTHSGEREIWYRCSVCGKFFKDEAPVVEGEIVGDVPEEHGHGASEDNG